MSSVYVYAIMKFMMF